MKKQVKRIRNESVDLYEMGLDDTFAKEGRVITDSSLGCLPAPDEKRVKE